MTQRKKLREARLKKKKTFMNANAESRKFYNVMLSPRVFIFLESILLCLRMEYEA